MRTQRMAAMSSLLLAGVMTMAACGSDNADGGQTAGDGADVACYSGNLTAEGSSAQKSAFEDAVNTYTKNCKDAKISYNPTGSGAGIKQFIAGQVDFAGSDSALKTTVKDGKIEAQEAAKYCGSPAWNLPMVTGPIALAYNIDGVDSLVLTPQVAADIFNGKLTTWNDPAIAAINEGTTLPDTPIKVFFRSDESGTTENFTTYLKAAAPSAWTTPPGKKWTGRVGEGREKSAGVTQGVASTAGGITYVEWSYAKDADLRYAKIDNGSGAVELTGESVGKAVSAATQTGQGHDVALTLDYATKEPGAYPILLVTYEIVCSKNKDAAKGQGIASFLKHFSSTEFQSGLEEIGFAPLPDSVREKVAAAVDALA